MTTVGIAVDTLVVVSAATGMRLAARPAARPAEPPRTVASQRGPAFWLGIVTAAIFVNQVLFTVYVLRVHDGDPAFIARYLPPGWFDLADGSVMRSVAAMFPAPELLSPSVLRVQAFLELPFVVLAYLCVCRWLDPSRATVLVHPAVLTAACVAWSLVFGLVEWGLRNPYTTEDLVLRALSCVVTAVLTARLPDPPPRPVRSLGQLVAALISTTALAVIILIVYDTALLYNLGHTTNLAPVAAAALLVLGAARVAAARLRPVPAGPACDTVSAGLTWFAVLFFVPALPIRYALDLGTLWLAAAATVAVAAVATVLTLRETTPPWPHLLPAAAAGATASSAALLPPPTFPEVRILLAAGLFLAATLTVCAVTDRLTRTATTDPAP